MNRVAPPADFKLVTTPFAGDSCGYQQVGSTAYHLAYLPEDDVRMVGPIVPYTNQAYDRVTGAPSAPSQAMVEQAIDDFLASAEGALLRQWINHTLGSPGEENPLVGTVPDCAGLTAPACKQALREVGFENFIETTRTEPDYAYGPSAVVATTPGPNLRRDLGTDIRLDMNPGREPGTNERSGTDCDDNGELDPGVRDRYDQPPWGGPFSVTGRADPPVLYWGTSRWGYRKIKTWHGWDAAKSARTGYALLAPPVPEEVLSPQPNPWPSSDGSYAYYYFWANGGTHCTTMVLLRPEIHPLTDEPRPKHIVNSYAYVGWYQQRPQSPE